MLSLRFSMMFSRNVFLASGVFILVYIMVKLFMNKSDKNSRKRSNISESEEIAKEEIFKYTTESTQNQTEVNKIDNSGTMKIFKLKPNFFIAFQVNNTGIHSRIKKLQEKVIAKNPSLFPALVRVSTLHVTLAVTYLANEADINTVKSKLDKWAEENRKIFFEEACVLSFRGVKTFNNIIAYVDIDQSPSYKKIVEISNSVNNLLSSAGFIVDKKNFKPHLTFLKLSKDFKLLKLKKNFKKDFELLKKCHEHFGKQEITSIQLLSMDEPKDKAGYYKCYHQIEVSDTQLNVDHSKCCDPVVQPEAVVKGEIKNISHNLKGKK